MIDSTWQATVSSLGLGVLWLGGIVHGLIANRQWLALRPATGVATAAGSASLPGFAPPPIPVATPSFPHPPGARQWSDGTLDQPLASLEIQRTTATRMDAAIDDTVGRLRLLEARMGEAVVRMLELSAQTAPGRALPETTDVTNLLDDIEALRQSLDEVHSLDASNPPIR